VSATTTASKLIAHRGSVDPWGRNRESMNELAALREQLNVEARDNWDNAEWHRQVAAELATSLVYQFTFENLLGQFFQVETVGEFV